MVHNSTLKDFEKALSRLDELLIERNFAPIEIRALGGFAMMYYGVREQGYTVDIYSLTSKYDDKVLELIVEIDNELAYIYCNNHWNSTMFLPIIYNTL